MSPHHAVGVGVLVSAAWMGCGRGAEAPDAALFDEAAVVARRVEGPVAIVVPDGSLTTGVDVHADAEFVPADPAQLERVRDSRTLLVPPRLTRALELRGYLLRPVADSAGWARVSGRLNCASVRSTSWSPLPGLEFSGRIGLEIPPWPGGELVLVAGDHGPLRIVAETPEGTGIPLVVEPLQNAPGTDAPPADFWLERGNPGAAPPEVVRVRLPAAANGHRLIGVRFGRRAPQVLARLRGYEGDARARVCAAPLGGEDALTEEVRVADLLVDRPEMYGAGWFGETITAAGSVRWMGAEAALLVPSGVASGVRIEIDATPPEDAPLARLELSVNGAPLSGQALEPGFQVHAWTIPAGLWLAGTNEILLRVSATTSRGDGGGMDRRELGLGVRGIRVQATP